MCPNDEFNDHDPRVPDRVLEQLGEKPASHDGSDDSFLEPDGENVIGHNTNTGNPIVAPRKPEKKESYEAPKVQVAQSQDIKELINRIRESSDYRPVDLPSNGIPYMADSPLKEGKVLMRPMRAGEEEILSTPKFFKDGQAIEMIFKQCIQFPSKMPLDDPRQLLSLDRTYLLIYLRAISYGNLYECSVNCATCRATFDTIIDLENELDCDFLEDVDFKEPLKGMWPEIKFPFYYRLSRGFDEHQLLKMDRDRKSKFSNPTDQSLLNRANLLITQIGDEESGFCTNDPKQIRQVLQELVAKDLYETRRCLDSQPFGVDARVVLDCPKCGAENIMALPMGADFFLPRARTNSNPSQD